MENRVKVCHCDELRQTAPGRKSQQAQFVVCRNYSQGIGLGVWRSIVENATFLLLRRMALAGRTPTAAGVTFTCSWMTSCLPTYSRTLILSTWTVKALPL